MSNQNSNVLASPLLPHEIEWRVQSQTKDGKKLLVVPYATNRTVMERFDSAFTSLGWMSQFRPIEENGKLIGFICRISVKDSSGAWIYKEDASKVSDIEPIKGGISGAMKRAAVMFGLGRSLYDFPVVYIEHAADKYLPDWANKWLDALVTKINSGATVRERVTIQDKTFPTDLAQAPAASAPASTPPAAPIPEATTKLAIGNHPAPKAPESSAPASSPAPATTTPVKEPEPFVPKEDAPTMYYANGLKEVATMEEFDLYDKEVREDIRLGITLQQSLLKQSLIKRLTLVKDVPTATKVGFAIVANRYHLIPDDFTALQADLMEEAGHYGISYVDKKFKVTES